MNFIYPVIRWFLFKMDGEKSHDLTLKWLKKIENSPFRFLITQRMVDDPVEVFGIKFPNRVGLAAGLDKNGSCIDAFAAMGFGHIEIGTVTPRPQPGNPKPRLFRAPKQGALINRFGFNNRGVDQLVENVKKSRFKGILGINIGKNFDTPAEKAVNDYLICMDKVFAYASYITINISSPNTANLRDLQFGEALDELLSAVKSKQQSLSQQYEKYVPVLVKIAPDLSEKEVIELADTFVKHQVDGVIATNTTFSRAGIENQAVASEQGGMSGAPLLEASNRVLAQLSQRVDGAFPIIGVGGVDSELAASKKFAAGAALVQIYSGFIFKGSKLIYQVAKAGQKIANLKSK